MVNRDAPGTSAPRWVVLTVCAYLVLAWAAVYAVDVAGVAGLGERLDAPLWAHLFLEGHLTELLQWAVLGAAVLTAGRLSGHLRATGQRGDASLWLLMALAFVLILIEDAGNVRHTLRDYGEAVLGIPGFVTNALVLSAIAALPLCALALHWRRVWAVRRGRGYLLAGFVTYGLAGGMSATGALWYPRAGALLDAVLFGGRLPVYDLVDIAHHYLVMDLMVEESVELLGAGLFLAGAVAFSHQHRALLPRAGHGDTGSAAAGAHTQPPPGGRLLRHHGGARSEDA